MRNEPVITVAAIQAVISAVLTLLVAFGVVLTDKQFAAIIGLWATVGPVLFALWARRHTVAANPKP